MSPMKVRQYLRELDCEGDEFMSFEANLGCIEEAECSDDDDYACSSDICSEDAEEDDHVDGEDEDVSDENWSPVITEGDVM